MSGMSDQGQRVRITWRGFTLFAAWFAAMAFVGTWAVKRYLVPGTVLRSANLIEAPAPARNPVPVRASAPRINASAVRAGIAEVQRSIDAPRLPQGVSQPDFQVGSGTTVKCIDGWLYALRTINGVHHIELATRQNTAIPCTYTGRGAP